MYQHPHIDDTKFATHTFQKVADTMVWKIIDVNIPNKLARYFRIVFMSDQMIVLDFQYSQ